MKPEKEGQDSLNNIIRQAIGKESLLSFSRTGDNPVQWIQLTHALDHQESSNISKSLKLDNFVGGQEHPFELCKDETGAMNEVKEAGCPSKDSASTTKGTKSSSEQIQALRIPEAVLAFAQAAARANGEPEKYLPGWPLLSPPKVQLQKCEKCSREFCSMINYRRHILVHRRSLNIDKDFPRNREYLGAFWDKLSLDETKEILSFTNMAVEEVSGSSIMRALSSWIRKPFFSSLPQTYVKAGSALLDVIQARPSSSPKSSKELFSVLDDASEKTFLCTGTYVSIQKFVFDGEVTKIALEMKNLIACISFLVEQKLVKAWLADKDAEALRCHKLLMEEEEAAQRRQAELLERKRLKKLRQKEQKSKDFGAENEVSSPRSAECKTDFPGMPSPSTPSHLDLYTPELSENQDHYSLKFTGSLDAIVVTDLRTHMNTEVADQNIDQHQMNDRQHSISTQPFLSKSKRTVRNGFSPGQVPAAKSSVPTKYGLYKDPKTTSSATGYKIWAPKNKREEVLSDRMDKILGDQSVNVDSSEVIIGSICVALGNSDKTINQGKLVKPHTRHNNVKPSTGMLWKPVGHHENGDYMTMMSDTRVSNLEVSSAKTSKQNSANEIHLASVERRDYVSEAHQDFLVIQTSEGPLLFSSKIADAFLAHRWKEAIAADHVKLVLPSETEAFDCCDAPEYSCCEAMPESYDSFGRGILGSTEKGMPGLGLVVSSSSAFKPKFRTKPEKNCKLKYVPKQRNTASGD